MQEQQYAAPRDGRAGIHLRRAAPCACDNAISEGSGECGGLIRAAAVHHDNFSGARAERRERLQCRDDLLGFVENRNDDGKRGLLSQLAHSAASFSAPPQLEPWPAVQPKQWPATRIGFPAIFSLSR